ncbi:MAG: hypothetical protein K2G45_07410 [Lachnospiraceae bacterium]|nr:hypothetical protein [Lachnospiraceae bacterium]
MKITKKIYVGITILSAMFLFSSCGKEKKDNIEDDLRENVGVDASVSDTEKKNETDEIPENISYTVEVGGRTSKVDARIYADGYGNVPTFTVKECEDIEERVLNYAAKLFDNGEYTNVKPYTVLTREELEAELQIYKERQSDSFNSQLDILEIEYMLEEGGGNPEKSPDDQILFSDDFDYYLNDGGDEGHLSLNEINLRGYVNGRLWKFNYKDGYNNQTINGKTENQKYIPCLEARCIDDEYEVKNTYDIGETFLNNTCNREDAEKKAKELLQKLGFQDMELLHIVQNYLGKEGNDLLIDGYTMLFGMSQNGAHLLYAKGSLEVAAGQEAAYSATQPYVEVIVNSNGIYQVRIMGNYSEPEILAENSNMLSFEQVNEIAKEEFQRSMTESDSRSFNIDTIEFGYVYITYDGLSYAIVPVWRYYSAAGDRNEQNRCACLTIGALDGAIIYDGNDKANFTNIHRMLIEYF